MADGRTGPRRKTPGKFEGHGNRQDVLSQGATSSSGEGAGRVCAMRPYEIGLFGKRACPTALEESKGTKLSHYPLDTDFWGMM